MEILAAILEFAMIICFFVMTAKLSKIAHLLDILNENTIKAAQQAHSDANGLNKSINGQ